MSELSITIFILILPGIISLIVINCLASHVKFNSFFFVLYSIVLGLFDYCFLQLFRWGAALFKSISSFSCLKFKCLGVWEIIGLNKSVAITPMEIITATLIAVPVGFFITVIINHKLLYKVARWLKISSKYGDENLFSYYLNTDEVDWVYVRDKENEVVYQGRVENYSETDRIQEIVLTNVTVFTYYEPTKIYSTQSIYICRESGKIQIEQIPEENFNGIKSGGTHGR